MARTKELAREPAFYETTKSIREIKNKGLRRDFAEVLAGAEFGVQNGDAEITNTCVGALRSMTYFLCRTIGGSAALSILEGLAADGERPSSGISALMLDNGEIVWKKGHRCPRGGGRCVKKRNFKCTHFGGGCASTSPQGRLRAVTSWGVTLLDEA